MNTEPIRYILTSHSIDNVFDYCARKFEFLNVYDRRPPRESGFAAQVGTALHEGTQAWLIARAQGLSPDVCEQSAFFAMLLHYPWAEELDQASRARSYEKVILALTKIINDPLWEDWELVQVKDRGWAIEIPWIIRHTSVGEFRLKSTGELCMLATQGKIDFILYNRKLNLYRTWDLKTTIYAEGLVRAEYRYSGQQVGYSNVLHAMLGITPDQFDVGYLICRFMSDDEAAIQPIMIPKGKEELEDYWLGKLDRLYRMRAYAEQGYFPRTNGGCHSFGKECSMFEICGTRDSDLIRRWFDTIDSQPQQPYDYWVELEA